MTLLHNRFNYCYHPLCRIELNLFHLFHRVVLVPDLLVVALLIRQYFYSLSLSLSLSWINCDSSSTTAVSTRYLFLLSFYFISFTCRLWIFCFLLVWIVDDIDTYFASNAPISGSRFCYSTSPSPSCVAIGTSTTAISNDSVSSLCLSLGVFIHRISIHLPWLFSIQEFYQNTTN